MVIYRTRHVLRLVMEQNQSKKKRKFKTVEELVKNKLLIVDVCRLNKVAHVYPVYRQSSFTHNTHTYST